MGRLENRIALVTGGAAGLGKAIAQRLAADGAKVVISDVDIDTGTATAAQYDFTYLEQDVCDEKRWFEVVSEIERRFGGLSILVNNAGILGRMDATTPENTSLASWRRIFAVNVEGVFLGCRTGISAMKRTGFGSIINISSAAGLLATPFATAYGASKATIRQLTKSVAQYCAQEKVNIRCNSVHPGNVLTPFWEKQAQELAAARGVSIEVIIAEGQAETPMGDFTLPEDVAAACSFLASDDARYVTGTKLIVDGGIINCDTYHIVSRNFAGEQRPTAVMTEQK